MDDTAEAKAYQDVSWINSTCIHSFDHFYRGGSSAANLFGIVFSK